MVLYQPSQHTETTQAIVRTLAALYPMQLISWARSAAVSCASSALWHLKLKSHSSQAAKTTLELVTILQVCASKHPAEVAFVGGWVAGQYIHVGASHIIAAVCLSRAMQLYT